MTRELALPCETGAYRPRAVVGDTICFGYGDESLLGQHMKLLVVDRVALCPVAASRGATLLLWACRPSYVCRKCICNMHHALCSRHGAKQPETVDDVSRLARLLEPLRDAFRAAYVVEPVLERAVWADRWPKHKREAIAKSELADPMRENAVKLMVKREGGHNAPSRPRGIQMYYNLATQCAFAPQFSALQKAFAKVARPCELGSGVRAWFASGMTPQELSAWMNEAVLQGCWGFYERDGKNWDSTMTCDLLNLPRVLYDVVGDEFLAYWDKCRNVRGYGFTPFGRVIYDVVGTTKSGQNDTSLTNSIINMLIAAHACLTLGLRAWVLVAGDDLLVALFDPADCESLAAVEARCGIIPTARVFRRPEDVSFISGVWLLDGVEYRFTPKPGRLLARLWWTCNPPPTKRLGAYLRGVAKGLWPICCGIPLVRCFLERHLDDGPVMISDKWYWLKDAVQYEWTGAQVVAFADRYGVTEAAVRDCESWIRSLPIEPLVLVHPVLEAVLAVDLADAVDRPAGGCY